MIYIGIDPGTHTGLAVWNGSVLVECTTLPIHKAMGFVMSYRDRCAARREGLAVVFEDARQRTWFGRDKNSTAKLQGAGSIKRDCSIWEDFLTDEGIEFRAVPPVRGGTKLDADYFAELSGWTGKTSNHARDAAILVIGR